MKNPRLARLLSILIGLAAVSTSAFAQRWAFSLGGAYFGGLKFEDTPYSLKTFGDVTLSDAGTIAASPKNGFGATLGVIFSFSKNLGLMAQFGVLSPTPVDIKTDYRFSWTFESADNTGTYAITREMTNTGDISGGAMNLNLVLSLPLGKSTLVNLSGGLSVVSATLRLYACMGNGVSWSASVDDLKWKFTGSSAYSTTTKTAYWVDYYILPLISETEISTAGFNACLELEQKISKKLGIFIGAYYCVTGKTDVEWQLDSVSTLEGVFGNLDSTTTGSVFLDSPPVSSLSFTHFSALAGIKFHL
jgi:hypothetical protein